MIIGNGDIASALKEVDRDNLLFFASGVSNSQETDEEEYSRERHLLVNQNRNYHIVYFSSLAVFYTTSRYVRHKKEMESVVKRFFPMHTIVRIGNITWGNNPHTFLNAYKAKPYEPKDEYRYMLEKEEFLHWIKLIPQWNCEMNIPGQRMKVADVVKKYGYPNLLIK